jgi:hypothetical protein
LCDELFDDIQIFEMFIHLCLCTLRHKQFFCCIPLDSTLQNPSKHFIKMSQPCLCLGSALSQPRLCFVLALSQPCLCLGFVLSHPWFCLNFNLGSALSQPYLCLVSSFSVSCVCLVCDFSVCLCSHHNLSGVCPDASVSSLAAQPHNTF